MGIRMETFPVVHCIIIGRCSFARCIPEIVPMGKLITLQRDFLITKRSMSMKNPGIPVYHPVSLNRDYLAGKMLDRYAEAHPKTWQAFSPRRRERIRAEFVDMIGSLQESLATGSPAFLIDHTCRQQSRFTARHLHEGLAVSYLEVLKDILAQELPPDYREHAGAFIKKAVSALKSPAKSDPCIAPESSLSPTARSFLDAILAADRNRADAIIDDALAAGTTVHDIYLDVFQPVLRETGKLWQQNKATVAQEHYVTGFIRQSMAHVHDRVAVSGAKTPQKKSIVTASVGEELHDIGIRMVADFFEMDGWDVYYTGANTPVKCILETARDRKADAVALSITMPSRLPDVQYLIRSLRADATTAHVKIIIGGYPFTVIPDLWKQVGADAYAADADDAVAAANRLIAGKR
jgi:methanogenic corrinoid protein MtbC1